MEPRDKTTRTFEIKIDYSSIDRATKKLKDFEGALVKTLDKDSYSNMAKAFKETQVSLQTIDKLQDLKSIVQQMPATAKNLKMIADLTKQIRQKERKQKMSAGAVADQFRSFGDKLLETGKDAFNKIVSYFKSSMQTAIKEIKSMTSYYSGGLFYSTSARRQQLQYGLSDAQNYALSKSLDYLGFGSIEDVWLGNEQQQNKFAEKMAQYSAEYEKNLNSGFYKDIDELTEEFKDLKEDLTYDLIGWIKENKDTIKTFFKTSLELMKVVAQATVGILNAITWMFNLDTRAKTSDIISEHSSGSVSGTRWITNNVNVSNNFSNVNAGDQGTLVTAGKQLNRQMLKIFNE